MSLSRRWRNLIASAHELAEVNVAFSSRSKVWLRVALAVCLLVGVAASLSMLAGARHPESPVTSAEVRQPVAVFIGDSYTQGADKWPSKVAADQVWREVNLGRGGTGYSKRLSGKDATKGCGLSECANFPEMASVAVQRKADIVLVAGGRNDGGADITTQVNETFRRLREGLPEARIIAVQPMWDASQYPRFLIGYSTLIQRAVESIGGQYLEIGTPLEGRPDLIQPDGVHPTKEGQTVLAEAVNRELRLN
jgi:acyl-CoA thioesterase-1